MPPSIGGGKEHDRERGGDSLGRARLRSRQPAERPRAARENTAPQPFSCASAAATGGATGASSAVRSARPSISATTGDADDIRRARSTSDTWWNWSHVTGAVARPHAVETPTSCASERGTGYPSSARTMRGVSRKMELTAANES